VAFSWPAPGFARIPAEPWTTAPVEALATGYDAVRDHGWYENLDPTVEELTRSLRDGDILVDYSGGTGILIERLLERAGAAASFGVVDVDSSPKFLRLALEKLGDEPRVAFRLIRYLKDQKRLEYLDEVLGDALVARGVDGIVSANAIHLYQDLDGTLAAWARSLRSGGFVHVQSGNIRLSGVAKGWIIDDTIEAIHEAAVAIVRETPEFAAYRQALDDPVRSAAYDSLRRKFFLPARAVGFYVDALQRAGFSSVEVKTRPVTARVDEWRDFLAVYLEGILGWVGGSERVEPRPPSAADLGARHRLLDAAIDRVFCGRASFEATWTYLSSRT
jgi:ubiquinone/menaquinone biosynthesis C-methylase UbiE